MRFVEIDLFGVYVAPNSLMLVAAWLAVMALRRLAVRLGSRTDGIWPVQADHLPRPFLHACRVLAHSAQAGRSGQDEPARTGWESTYQRRNAVATKPTTSVRLVTAA